jgi:amino acid transporter
VAVGLQLIVGLGVALGLGLADDPLWGFIFRAPLVTAVVILLYIAVNVACSAYYLRERRDEFNWFKHLVVPIVGIAVFIPGWLTAVGIPALDFIGRLTTPASYSGLVVGVWMALGVIYLVYLYARNPQRVRDTGKVFLEEELVSRAPTPAP